MCLFLRISPEEAAKRGGFGVERYENETMQTRVRELFQTLFDLKQGDYIHAIDAGRSFDAVSEDILKTVTDSIERLDVMGPLKRLRPLAN
jgi:dTMP kinase